MRVERLMWEDGKERLVTLRIMDTTCPKCKQHVQFALQDEEFLGEENKWLVEQNNKLRDEISRLREVIYTMRYT